MTKCDCCCEKPVQESKLLGQVTRGLLLVAAAVVLVAVVQADQLSWATLVTLLAFAAGAGLIGVALGVFVERNANPWPELRDALAGAGRFNAVTPTTPADSSPAASTAVAKIPAKKAAARKAPASQAVKQALKP